VLAIFYIPLFFVLVRRGTRDGIKGLRRGADPSDPDVKDNGDKDGDDPKGGAPTPPQLPAPAGVPALPAPDHA